MYTEIMSMVKNAALCPLFSCNPHHAIYRISVYSIIHSLELLSVKYETDDEESRAPHSHTGLAHIQGARGCLAPSRHKLAPVITKYIV